MSWTLGDVSGSATLTDLDHLFPSHINELRTASDSTNNALTTTNTNVSNLSASTSAQQAILAGQIATVAARYPIMNIVTDFGAVGDGVTDNKNVYTTASAALTTLGYGTMLFPAGNFYSSRPWIPVQRTVTEGMGIDVTILSQSSASTGGNGDVIRATKSTVPYISRITIKNLTVDASAPYPTGQVGSNPGSYSNGITLQGVDDLIIENVKVIKPFGYGVQIGSPAGEAPYILRPQVRNLHVVGERCGQDSLGGGGIIGGTVDGLYVYPADDGSNPYGTVTNWTNMRETTIKNVRGWTTFIYAMNARTTPAVPLTNAELVNPYAFPVTVALSGGTFTDVKINNVSQGTGGTYTLPGFGIISITYSVAPTWTWSVATAPAVPASTVAATNPFPFPTPVTVTGGTVSAVYVNGVLQSGTFGYFFIPLNGTISMTYSSAPTWSWATRSPQNAAAIETDFGAYEVHYSDIYINGFYNGMLIDNSNTHAMVGNITIRDAKIINMGFNGIKTAVYSGGGITGVIVADSYLTAYGMLGAAPGINLTGSQRFSLRGNKFGKGGVTSYAISLQTDGVNVCDYGDLTGNDVSADPAYGINSSGGIGSNVYIGNNPGNNDNYGWTAVPSTATSTGYAGQMAYDSSYLYTCVSTNNWKRVAIATW